MKLFVTDYDNTLLTTEENLKKNIKKIHELKKYDYLIVIATGRSLPAIKKEVEKYSIPYDYLACADGSIIYDKNHQIVKMFTMSNDIIKEIINFKQNLHYEEIQISYKTGYSNIIDANKDILGINIVMHENHYNNKVKERFLNLKIQYPNYNYLLYTHTPYTYMCVKEKDVSKAYAIQFLANKLEIKQNDIYVIGDSNNDFEMIQQFHGVGMLNSTIDIKEIATKLYPEVYNYINDLI